MFYYEMQFNLFYMHNNSTHVSVVNFYFVTKCQKSNFGVLVYLKYSLNDQQWSV